MDTLKTMLFKIQTYDNGSSKKLIYLNITFWERGPMVNASS